MKHDLQAFSQDIVALIKTGGDSGGSGDKLKKSLGEKDNFVPTDPQLVSPLKNEWGQPAPLSGDRKTKQFESVTKSVPTVPTATTNLQGGSARALVINCPAEWYAILTELSRRQPLEWLSGDRWFELIADAEIFLTRWGTAAQQLGWTALDLLGVHPLAPVARVGCWGLILFVQGGEVIALTDDTATIRRRSGRS